ncbi:MAG TPA: DUF4956 domain-containing protein [Vicinamibacterales bacterium]|jgi:uncharacterized membrane protein YhiD involved in acid resistance|nr:DUF4956 domain-containing protein [Vicinamibacterales bacterium]
MPESLAPLIDFDSGALVLMSARLVLAFVLGLAIAWVYKRARRADGESDSFGVTLVLLTILIAMVTQVIGDNVARAFSLVGALSIVRFRTVVRDTQDTAYVIFAVAIGMAMGANHPTVALCGLAVVGGAALLLRRRSMTLPPPTDEQLPYALHVRMALGHDADALLGATLDQFVSGRRLVSVTTARQGMSIDASYHAALRGDNHASALVNALNRIDGVQNVELHRREEQVD